MRSSKTRVSCAWASASSSSQRGERDAGFLERGRDLLRERGRLAGHQLLDPGADRAELFDLVEPVGRGRAHADRELFFEPGHADLEELVDVAAEDREELRPFEQRDRRILGEREHPGLELEHRQFPVEVAGTLRRRVDSGGLMGQSYGLAPAPASGPARDRRTLRELRRIGPARRASYDGALRTRAPTSSRRRSRRSPGSRSPTRSGWPATSS